MDKEKVKRIKKMLEDRPAEMTAEDVKNPSSIEYAKNMASLHLKLCEICEAADDYETSSRSYSMYGGVEPGRDGTSYRRGRSSTTGRYMSRDSGYGYAMHGEDPGEAIRELMDNPEITGQAREFLRKAMDAVGR